MVVYPPPCLPPREEIKIQVQFLKQIRYFYRVLPVPNCHNFVLSGLLRFMRKELHDRAVSEKPSTSRN
jgi:hypothetical protein